jgi:hypothetical protein
MDDNSKILDELYFGMFLHEKRFSKPCNSKKLSCVNGLSLVYYEYGSELTSVMRPGEKEIFQSL